MSIQDNATTRTPADDAAAAREAERIRSERFERQMKALLPEGWTWGYIGNCGFNYDDRSWRIFVPHPGRVGGTGDTIGDFSTENRYQLLTLAQGIAFGRAKMAEGR
jgi:hypothetical protein